MHHMVQRSFGELPYGVTVIKELIELLKITSLSVY